MANERARALRKNRTSTERKLWWRLRDLKHRGWKFRQQAPIDHFIVDFVCLSHRLIVEIDGATHGTADEIARDARRERYLRDQGFDILRVWNSDVYDNVAGVLDAIVQALEAREHAGTNTPTPAPSPQGGGE